MPDPKFVNVEEFAEHEAHYKAEQVGRDEFLPHYHQRQNKQSLKDVRPGSERERGNTSENAYGTLEIADIPAAEYSIRTTPKLFMSTAKGRASSPRNNVFSFDMICASFYYLPDFILALSVPRFKCIIFIIP